VNSFDTKGYFIIDDFLDLEDAKIFQEFFLNANNWIKYEQAHDGSYGKGKYGKYNCNFEGFPTEKEWYFAKFWRSKQLENEIEDTYRRLFSNKLSNLTNTNLGNFDIRCNKLQIGDHYRIHNDGWQSDIGCVYFVNDDWLWDWGGILHMKIEDTIESIIPRFNRLVVFNNMKFNTFHWVSPVTDWAKYERYSLICFNSEDDKNV